ncbi:nuclear GTPase SLIP-GC-like isoform X2 [Sparus aurata]|uniref:Nuclear GTPase SLIP-GC-like n=1 Tax=Sparus aurata TaxID=8175 RepID=A0A671Y5L5_SPAAU|nr:nuclear GTPase SLIP-GC-like isoform X2 [Sparus aurata]
MGDFVQNKLTEWNLSDLITAFEAEDIDEGNICDLQDDTIRELIPKAGPRDHFKAKLKSLREEQNKTNHATLDSPAQEHEEAADSAQVLPSTRGTNDKGKRKYDPQDESSKRQSLTTKRQRFTTAQSSSQEQHILCLVKDIMTAVHHKIPKEDKLSTFLKDKIDEKIKDLENDKKELVGVFGKTGAGKSSLINAVTEERNLLPSGSICACTSVMIKVEANMQSEKYEADIEFITKEEWHDEVHTFLGQKTAQEEYDDNDRAIAEKLSALYGDEWRNKSSEELMDDKYFEEIEFLCSKKTLTCGSAKELSEKYVRYTRNGGKNWPLVKCVTVRVPKNRLLQHVTLVDLPGTGDRNKSRDEMWKEVIGSCSIVWIVTDINRAASEKEPWEILERTCSLMGNGGQCQQIHFICTKTDLIDKDEKPAADVCAESKEEVSKQFRKLTKVERHFGRDDYFEVFTVSSKEFLKKNRPEQENEIPKLQKFLQNLNDCHSETKNYVSGALGILSLIQGARSREPGKKADVCNELEEKMRRELEKVNRTMDEAHKALEKCLSEGVEESKTTSESVLRSILYPSNLADGRGFHRILKCAVERNGSYKSEKTNIEIDLNKDIASCLTDCIDDGFNKTFPNDGKRGVYRAINAFSLVTELNQKYKDVELQLTFLKTEEETIKTETNKGVQREKKKVYNSVKTTIDEIMKECYERAAECSGPGTLQDMRDIIEAHVRDSNVFERAKDVMLRKLRALKVNSLKTLEEKMQRSIEMSIKTDGDSIPDVTHELVFVEKCYKKLNESSDEETSLI